jgi:iron(III) transport system permease protein
MMSGQPSGILSPGALASGRRSRMPLPTWPSVGFGFVVIGAAIVTLPVLAIASSLHAPSWDVLAHLAATVLPGMLLNTVLLCLLVGSGTLLIGTVSAYLVTVYRFPGSRALEWLLLLPLAMPAYIIGYAYTDLLTFAGPVQGWLRNAFGWSRGDYWFPEIHSIGGVSLMLTLVLYPYVYILARTAFLQQPRSLTDAAVVLGHSRMAIFLKMALPLARPALVAGLALALMETLADFGTMQYFGVDTFTTAIYRTWLGMGDRLAASQLSVGLLVLVLLVLWVERAARGSRGYASKAKHGDRGAIAHRLKGWLAFAAAAFCALPLLLGFVLPVVVLLRLHLSAGDPLLGERFLGYAWNSIRLAGLATLVIMVLALVFGLTLRHRPSRPLGALVRIATLGYALPGTIIAIGVLVPLAAFDNSMDAFIRATFGVSTGLLLSGTLGAILFAYVVRFMAVGFGAVEEGFLRINPNLDAAARTLGCTGAALGRRIHLPLLRRALLTGAVVVFVDVLKELPATLIVRPFNFDTLAVRVYQLASDERLAQASTGALVIVAIGLFPVILMVRAIGRGQAPAELASAGDDRLAHGAMAVSSARP